MEDNAIINDGDQAKLVPVTLKDHSKDPVLETKRERTALEKEVDAEIIAETCCAPKRKRGRPKKITKTELIREYYCGTCREVRGSGRFPPWSTSRLSSGGTPPGGSRE